MNNHLDVINQNTNLEQKYKILIIDDDNALTEVAKNVLVKNCYQVVCASSGFEAISLLASFTPDAIVLDINMPEMSGIEVCEIIRKNDKCTHTPIMMLTGEEDIESVQQAFEAGATDFTHKPVSWKILLQRLNNLLKSSENRHKLYEKESSMRSLLQAIPDRIIRTNESGDILYHKLVENSDEFSDVSYLDIHKTVLSNNSYLINMALHGHGIQSIEETVVLDGVEQRLEYRLVRETDKHVLVLIRNITELFSTKKRLYSLAFFNRITNLPNKYMLEEILSHGEVSFSIPLSVVRVSFYELDNIKNTLGKHVYRELLVCISKRLLKIYEKIQPDITHSIFDVFKLDASEFAFFYLDNNKEAGLANTINMISQVMSQPFTLENYELYITPCIGAAYAYDNEAVETLLDNAGEVCRQVSISTDPLSHVYSPQITSTSRRKISMLSELRRAIDNEEFTLQYQPQIQMKTQEISGFEALIRWNSDQYGFVSPDEFIPLAEESGLIIPIGDFVIRQVCKQLSLWHASGFEDFKVAINMSSLQIHKHNLVQYITDCLDRYQLKTSDIELELTETAFTDNISSLTSALHQFKDAGIRTALDDFGTGYSSLSYLSQLPFDVLKIDRSFVSYLDSNVNSSSLVDAIISMGRSLNLEILAEGVETTLQRDYLVSKGCDYIQGYLYSKPLIPDSIGRFLQDREQQLISAKAS